MCRVYLFGVHILIFYFFFFHCGHDQSSSAKRNRCLGAFLSCSLLCYVRSFLRVSAVVLISIVFVILFVNVSTLLGQSEVIDDPTTILPLELAIYGEGTDNSVSSVFLITFLDCVALYADQPELYNHRQVK